MASSTAGTDLELYACCSCTDKELDKPVDLVAMQFDTEKPVPRGGVLRVPSKPIVETVDVDACAPVPLPEEAPSRWSRASMYFSSPEPAPERVAPDEAEAAPPSMYERLVGGDAPPPGDHLTEEQQAFLASEDAAAEPAPPSVYESIFGAAPPPPPPPPANLSFTPGKSPPQATASFYDSLFGAPVAAAPADAGALPGGIQGTWRLDRVEPEEDFDAFMAELGFPYPVRLAALALIGGRFRFAAADGGATAVITELGVFGDEETRVPMDGTRFEFAGRTGEAVVLVATKDADKIYVTEERGEPPQVMKHVFACAGDEARRTTSSAAGTSFDAVFRRLP